MKWKLGGKSINEGFDSPAFAKYLLNKYSKTKISDDATYSMINTLVKTDQPRIGDIVFYEYGYTMFYFKYRNEPFCVGMTPIGVSSLQLNFGPEIIGYGKVAYQ